MSERKYAFVDLETTGTSPTTGRITEVAVVLFDGYRVEKTYQTLLNPEARIPEPITRITGISNEMVAHAPTFSQVAEEIQGLLEGRVFVAHNARFDYGFLKNEFARLETSFNAPTLCTVKLSRQLYPEHRRHGLDALIERFGLSVENRHRALDDVQLMIQLWALWCKDHGEKLEQALLQQLQGPILPPQLDRSQVDNLPSLPGVYYLYGEDDRIPIYIGKSVDIRKRVLSHFSGDHLTTKQAQMVRQVQRIDYHLTTGELGALLHESSEIKHHLPIFNRQLRRQKWMYTLERERGEAYDQLTIKKIEPAEFGANPHLYGCFKSPKEAKTVLEALVVDQGLCEKWLGLTPKVKGACFAHELKRCHGACVGKVSAVQHNLTLEEALHRYRLKEWWFDGPIAIEEACAVQQQSQVHFFDQWCYLGSLPGEEATDLSGLSSPVFDLDMYKILQRFFHKGLPENTRLVKLDPQSLNIKV